MVYNLLTHRSQCQMFICWFLPSLKTSIITVKSGGGERVFVCVSVTVALWVLSDAVCQYLLVVRKTSRRWHVWLWCVHVLLYHSEDISDWLWVKILLFWVEVWVGHVVAMVKIRGKRMHYVSEGPHKNRSTNVCSYLYVLDKYMYVLLGISFSSVTFTTPVQTTHTHKQSSTHSQTTKHTLLTKF